MFQQSIFAPFNWKLLKIGSVSLRDIRKNVPILQVGGSSPAPPTPPVIRIVLLHTDQISKRHNSSNAHAAYSLKLLYRRVST